MRAKRVFLALCLAAALVPFLTPKHSRVKDEGFPGWPTSFEGRSLVPLSLPERERRFAEGFPGRVAAFTDGDRIILLRWLPRVTRRLHPASDCYRGLGYTVRPLPLVQDFRGRRWGAFRAEKEGRRTLRVRERIRDGQGREWSDVSAWYWAALLGRTKGPWWAVAVAEGERREGLDDPREGV